MFKDLKDFAHKLATLPDADSSARQAAQSRQEQLTKPPGSLGRLEELAVFLAGGTGVTNCIDHGTSCARVIHVYFMTQGSGAAAAVLPTSTR